MGGREILILVKVAPYNLELDNIMNRHVNQGIELNNLEKVFEELQNPFAAQARIKKTIKPDQIIRVIDLVSMKEISINSHKW